VIAGMGLGFNPAELATVGMRIEDRVDILRETVEIARLIWKENNASYQGKIFSFENVTIEPKPAEPIPIFCGGSTRAAIRRAGGILRRLDSRSGPMATFDDRIKVFTPTDR
jgi:alkanesulfonate monooxygenase SsuD/methylene tetrahydromethanopterin reductase-like flavin-dependent oxidoreductase (luciferase family)